MIKSNVILDWDGTLTNIHSEFENFLEIYPKIALENLGLPQESITEFKQFEKRVLENPEKQLYHLGIPTCRGSIDPVITTQTAAQDIYTKMNNDSIATKFLIDSYIKANNLSEKTHTYRENKERTKEFLEKVKDNYNVAIVSSSSPAKIQNALLDLEIDIPVYGNAGKLFVSEGVLPNLELEEFPNPITLNRDSYVKILNDLKARGFNQSETYVIGDCFDLDLALPHFLGYNVIQIDNGHITDYEKNFLGKNAVKNYSELERLLF